MRERLIEILGKFKDCSVLVIGDIMLDKYVFGDVFRISREAPVQVVKVNKEEYVLGGAGNTANNISSLNGRAFIISIVGKDNKSKELINELNKRNINNTIIEDPNKPTIEKIRVIALNQQLLRIDYEDEKEINESMEERILNYVEELIKKVDIIVVSDYNKGLITKNLMENVVKFAKENNKLVMVDPRPHHKDYYKGCNLITPNQIEASEISGIKLNNKEDLVRVGKSLVEDFNCDVLITRGGEGMSLFMKKGEIKHMPTKSKEVYDVSGAGDTVVAGLALSLASGASLEEAMIIANYAAGIVVGKFGTSTTNIEEIIGKIKDGTD